MVSKSLRSNARYHRTTNRPDGWARRPSKRQRQHTCCRSQRTNHVPRRGPLAGTINADLETTGVLNYEGKLDCSMTAHPKVCPVTGELLAFSYFSFEQPYLKYKGQCRRQVTTGRGIELPEMVMMHDFNITRNFVIFMDLPLALIWSY